MRRPLSLRVPPEHAAHTHSQPGESVTVFVDGVLWGPATSLRQLRAADVMQARLLTDQEPVTAHAVRAGGVALEVTLRRVVR